MSVKIRLKRLGKKRSPHYRIVVADSRTKRDGRVIEEIGQYHPTENPSVILIQGDRAQYWLSVGAQPTEQVEALLKLTGDWGTFKGEKDAKNTVRTAEAKPVFQADEKKKPVLRPKTEAPEKVEKPAKAEKPAADSAASAADAAPEAATDAPADAPAVDAAEAPAEEAPAEAPAEAEVVETAAETPAEDAAPEAPADDDKAAEPEASDADKA